MLDTTWTYLLTMTTSSLFFLSQAYGQARDEGQLAEDPGAAERRADAPRDARRARRRRPLPAGGRDAAGRRGAERAHLPRLLLGRDDGEEHAAGPRQGWRHALLRHDRGSALRRRGALTERESRRSRPGWPVRQGRYHVVLEWIVTRCADAKRAACSRRDGDRAARQVLPAPRDARASATTWTRGCRSRAPPRNSAQFWRNSARNSPSRPVRPRRYVHLVQILVDSLLVLALLAPTRGSAPRRAARRWRPSSTVLSSSAFLDPFGNDDSLSENLQVDCLVTEINNGSERWTNGARKLPFDVVK